MIENCQVFDPEASFDREDVTEIIEILRGSAHDAFKDQNLYVGYVLLRAAFMLERGGAGGSPRRVFIGKPS